MKKNTSYTIGTLIILLLSAFVFVFAGVGFGSGNRQNKALVFGKYNKTEIRYEPESDFYNAASNYAQMYQRYGMEIDSTNHYYIMNNAFNDTVRNIAFKDAVIKSGYKIPEEAINREMRPYFYDEKGVYSSKLYRQTPTSKIQQIHEEVEKSLLVQRYIDDLFGSQSELVDSEALFGLKESDAELDFLASYTTNRRGFEMARFPMTDYPTEEKLRYANENTAKFVKYDMSAIIVEDKNIAKTVINRLANNEITFEDAVAEYSEKNYTNSEGKLTNKYQYQIENLLTNKADMAKLADLAVGNVSEAIETNGTFSIFKNNAEKVQPDFTSEETLRVVTTYISTFESSLIEDYFSAKAKELKNAPSFAEACEKVGAEKIDIPAFPLNYGSVEISTSVDTSISGLSNADTNENFLKTAFALKMNEVSDPIVMNNSIVVLKYVTEESADADTTVIDSLESFDTASAQKAIMSSEHLTNNFASVYYSNFMLND